MVQATAPQSAGRHRAHAAEPQAICIGDRVIAPCDVARIEAREKADWDVDGQLFNAALYLLVAGVVTGAVLMTGARDRYLIFSALLAAIGLAALQDVLKTPRVRYRQLDVVLKSGERLAVAHPDPDVVERLERSLASARV
jgi:hypothetical protein